MAIALLAASCETPEPLDPKDSIPGAQTYYNEALNISMRYPRVLSVKAEDRGTLDAPGLRLRLQYPGNKLDVLELTTHDPGMSGHFRSPMKEGSEHRVDVGGTGGSRFLIADPSGASIGDGTLQRVMVERYGRLYVFTGRGDIFDEIIEDFEFQETPPPAPTE